jgi:hypothetical protein
VTITCRLLTWLYLLSYPWLIPALFDPTNLPAALFLGALLPLVSWSYTSIRRDRLRNTKKSSR